MADAISKTDEERKQLDKMKTEFMSITSHELRSPMTPMRAQLQMLMGDYFGKLNEKQKASLEIVLRNTERLDKIITDFLEISRIEAARLKFDFKKVSLSKPTLNVIEELKGLMPEKKIKFEVNIGELPIMEVDPDRVMQVLRNLINNAIKFVPDNGKIIITAQPRKEDILFSVKDNGVGVDSKDMNKLFQPFSQIQNMYQHKSGGTGLGLAISKGIIESQNGKIWAESEGKNKGTSFYFTVPYVPVKEIKPIKILFSAEEDFNRRLKPVFREFLGIIGEQELDKLRKEKGLNKKSVEEYITELKSKGILSGEFAEEFKKEVMLIIVGETKVKKKSDVEKRTSSFFKREKNG